VRLLEGSDLREDRRDEVLDVVGHLPRRLGRELETPLPVDNLLLEPEIARLLADLLGQDLVLAASSLCATCSAAVRSSSSWLTLSVWMTS
jgi:hypothetical protein